MLDRLKAALRAFRGETPPSPVPMVSHSRTNLAEIQQAFLTGRPLPYADAPFLQAPFSNHSLTYSCMSIIAQAMASVHYTINKQQASTGNLVPVEGLPLQALLNDPYPGIYADFCQFIETIALYLEGSGNAWVMPDLPNSLGVPRSLLVLNSQHVRPDVDQKTGRLIRWIVRIQQIEIPVSLQDMIHMKYTNPDASDQILGLGPMQAARSAINADFSRQVYDSAFFKNGARPSLALTYTPPDTRPEDQFLTPEQITQTREAFYDAYSGMANAHKVAVIHGGFQLKELGISQKDMDFIEGRRWSRQEISAVFRVPVPLLNDFQYAGLGREGVSVAQRMLYENNIVPKVERLGSLFQKFLVDRYAPGFIGQFEIDQIPAMREDVGEKVDMAVKLATIGFPINQINKLLKLGFDPVAWGDDWLVPAGMTPAASIAGPEAYMNLLEQAVSPPDAETETETEDETEPDEPAEDTPEDELEDEAEGETDLPAAAHFLPKLAQQRTVQHGRRFALWRSFEAHYLPLQHAYASRLHRWVYMLRRETLRKVAKFYANQRTLPFAHRRTILDDLLDAILFDPERAKRLIWDFSETYMTRAVQAGAASAIELIPQADSIGIDNTQIIPFLRRKELLIQEIPDLIREQVTEAVREALITSAENGENLNEQSTRIEEAVQDIFTMSANRTRTIARTEMLSAVNYGRVEEYKTWGVSEHEWLSAQDELVRDDPIRGNHTIDGETVIVGQPFSNGLVMPHDPNGSASNVINCRCTTMPIVPTEEEGTTP